MNSSQHRCMNQAPASENQTQQQSLNSSLEDTVGSPLVHLGGMLLNGSTSSLPNSPLQPSVTSITYGPWYTTFATSLILDGPILPCTLKELSERQRQINRSKALKKGLDPSKALSGKYPPMINVASKYERRLDRRNFGDKKSLFEGGYVSQLEAMNSSEWENRMKNFKERGPSRLLKWDPSGPKNKEKQENTEPIEEEDLGDLDFTPPQNPIEAQQENVLDSGYSLSTIILDGCES
ncbi:troponin T [Trichonephila clavipes]|uniref:Troponin T n=1 Tax=Trichonephila clavipes TaxID=2585209 RepID=A0A8X6VEB3_TRICX|nr:troponin T [Trichonephila clavipes]